MLRSIWRFAYAFAPALAFTAISPTTSRSETLVASVEANGFSFSLGPASTIGGITFFFTTFDGSSGFPLSDCFDTFCTISEEASPTSPGSVTYRSDYVAQDAFGILEYGAASLTISAVDSDGNGIFDVLEQGRPGAFSISGTAVPDFNVFGSKVSSSISAFVARSAGSRVGTYSGTFINPTQTAHFSGPFALSGASGTMSYDPDGATASWNLSRRLLDGTTRNFSGTSQLLINRTDLDSLGVPGFSLSDSVSGLSILTQPATLGRLGNVFRGRVSVFDGEPLSSWPDYTEFLVEIVDPNDFDFDSLPSLVDNCASDHNPGQEDGDGDGTGNACDNCLLVSNGRLVTDEGGNAQLDADSDGCGNACDADFDNNGIAGSSDFNRLRSCFQRAASDVTPSGPCAPVDSDGSGVIGSADFNAFRKRFGQPAGPSSSGACP